MGSSGQHHLDHHRTSKQLQPGIASSWIIEASAGSTASHGTIGVDGSSPYVITGPSAEQRVDGSTMSASTGIAPATFSHALELSPTTRRTVRKRSIRSRQQKDSRGPTPRQDLRNQHHPTKSHWRFLRLSCTPVSQSQACSSSCFLNREPTNIGAKTQRLAAYLSVEAELMMAISLEGKEAIHLSNFKMKLILRSKNV